MSLRERAESPPSPDEVANSVSSLTVGHPLLSRSSNSLSSSAPSPRRGGALVSLKNFFTGSSSAREKVRLDSLVSTTGSIQKRIWDGLSKSANTDRRVNTLKQLQEVDGGYEGKENIEANRSKKVTNKIILDFMERGPSVLRNRLLQVSTLEGLYHDSVDMLDDEETREPVLRMLIELTETQQNCLGLSLRQQFFEIIRNFGCDELTMKWLSALSCEGKKIDGFERDMDHMIAAWVQESLADTDHPQALLVLQLVQSLIKHNSAYISATALTDIVRAVCVRGLWINDHLTQECFNVLDAVLKYSDMPRDQLLFVVPVICIQICDNKFRDQAWQLTKTLLSSQMGHRTRKNLQCLLEESYPLTINLNEDKTVRMLRGAVYCLANANWGHSQVDVARYSPANIIPSFEKAMVRHVDICSDVFISIRRLIHKYGRDLQQTTWVKILNLFQSALDLFQEMPSFSEKCEKMLKQQLNMTEQLYKEGHFSASHELLFSIIQKAIDRWKDSPANSLIEYRMHSISPMAPDWISTAYDLVKRYSDEKQTTERRTKAISCLHDLYTRYRLLFERDLITQLVLPVLQDTCRERDTRIQYQMINVLFDVAKTVNFRGDTDLFGKVMKLIKQLMNSSVAKIMLRLDEATEESSDRENTSEMDDVTALTLDNLAVMATEMNDVLDERWPQLTTKTLTLITSILVEHIDVQYNAGWLNDEGSLVRERVIIALLTIHCCPITSRIQRFNHSSEGGEARSNMFIKRRYDGHDGGFSWSEICRVITSVLTHDTSWNVIRACLERMGRILENVPFVKTAGDKQVDDLIHAVVDLYKRSERGEFFVPDELLAKFLPPVLATLLNYTAKHEWRNREICRVLIDCLQVEKHMEALIAIDMAVQLVPEPMSSCAFRLLDILRKLEQTATRAIPLLEFMSDSAEIGEFHRLFNEEHFRIVVDILVPYADTRKYHTYVVACVHRILMRWYTQIPIYGPQRNNIANYIEQKVNDIPLRKVLDGMKRQHSGDGRQIGGTLFLVGGYETPPPMGSSLGCDVSEKGVQYTADIVTAMTSFFKLGHIEDFIDPAKSWLLQDSGDKYEEVSLEHYFVNDTIISLRKLVDKREIADDDDSVFTNDGDMESPVSPSDGLASSYNNSFVDHQTMRRRHQSAIQQRKNSGNRMATNALDDLYASGGPLRNQFKPIVKKPLLSFVQLTVRHMYGRSTWLTRSFDDWPDDFERSLAMPGSSASLIFHMLNTSIGKGLLRLVKGEDLERRINLLDRTPGIEFHPVGVLYIGPDQQTDPEILSNVYGSERYAKFIKGLGDVLPLGNIPLPGGIVKEVHGKYTYEYKDALSTINYMVATLMPNHPNDPNRYSKKKLIANNYVSIVWNESGKPYQRGGVSGKFDLVALEVVPSDKNTVVITVHADSTAATCMALRRVLLCDSAARRLLRKMIVRAHLAVNVNQHPGYISRGVQRLHKIRELRDKSASIPVLPSTASFP